MGDLNLCQRRKGQEVRKWLFSHNTLTLLYSVVGQVGDDEGAETSASSRCCAGLLVVFSVLLIILFFPLSMVYVVKVRIYYRVSSILNVGVANILLTVRFFLKVIPEYQRAVIFRLGRVEEGEAKGPGQFKRDNRGALSIISGLNGSRNLKYLVYTIRNILPHPMY